jgi:hypothetical protein
MDELQISGKRFISSRRIARENGYTSDYIGQLIRGGKIIGQKVGRAWYVDAASFDAYLGQEGTAPVVVAESEAPPEVPEVAVVEEHEELLPEPTPEAITAAIEEKKEEEKEEEEVDEIVALPDLPESMEPILSEKDLIENTVEEPVDAQEEEKESAPMHVPLHIATAKTEQAHTGGLHYVAEDAPGLPEIRRNRKESRVEAAHDVQDELAEEVYVPTRVERAGRGHLAALALAGIMIFVFSAVVSSALSLNLTIHEGNSASTYYSIDW